MAYVLVGEPASTSPKHALVPVSSPCARVRSGSPPESRPTKTGTKVQIEICLREKSPKTGISGNLAGDFRQFLAKVAAIRSLEYRARRARKPYFAGFPRLWCNLS